MLHDALEIVDASGEELVETDHGEPVADQPLAKMRSDEAGSAGDENSHDRLLDAVAMLTLAQMPMPMWARTSTRTAGSGSRVRSRAIFRKQRSTTASICAGAARQTRCRTEPDRRFRNHPAFEHAAPAAETRVPHELGGAARAGSNEDAAAEPRVRAATRRERVTWSCRTRTTRVYVLATPLSRRRIPGRASRAGTRTPSRR